MNISTVNELIQSLESAGELSIKERKYLDIMRWAVGVAGERDAALNAERVWEKTMMEACGEDGPASVASEIRALQVLRDTRIQALNSQAEQLAAENVALKAAFHPSDIPSEWTDVFGDTAVIEHDAAGDNQGHSISWSWVDNQEEVIKSVLLAVDKGIKTPATDRIVAGIKADGVEEFLKGSQLPYQIATVLADYDNADDETLHHVIWSGQPPEPDGDVWHLEYVSRGNAIVREVLKQLREGAR